MATWMVVESEPGILDFTLALFEVLGVEGLGFEDARPAMQWIEAVDRGEYDGELPELALLDIRSTGAPDTDGLGGSLVGARMRRSPRLADTALILTTAYHLPPADKQAQLDAIQTRWYLQKPFPPMPRLRALFEQAIAERRQPARHAAIRR